MNSNEILAIAPYWCSITKTWVFDDSKYDLVAEPFVNGIPAMIDELVDGIPDAKSGFRLLFSSRPFPNYGRKLNRLRPEYGGWWYSLDEKPDQEGWICAVLFKYYSEAPESLFVKAEEL